MKLVQLNDILTVVALSTSVSVSRMLGPSKHRSISHARILFAHLAMRWTNFSYEEIGLFIRRDHSTVMSNSRAWFETSRKFPLLVQVRDHCDHSLRELGFEPAACADTYRAGKAPDRRDQHRSWASRVPAGEESQVSA